MTGKGLVVHEDYAKGRPLSEADSNALAKDLRAILNLKGTAIGFSTVSRHLTKEFGLKSHRPARKP